MNHGPSDDRISAYFDREIPSEDRKNFEAKVQENPALQQSLDELHTLSSLIKDQSSYSAPDDLLESVMAAVHAEVVHEETVREESQNHPTPQSSRGISPRLFAASLITTAALMLLISQWALISQSDSHQLAMNDQEKKLSDAQLQEQLALNDAEHANKALNQANNLYAALQQKDQGNRTGNIPTLMQNSLLREPYTNPKTFDFAHIEPSPILVAYDNDAFRKATPKELFDRFSKKWGQVNLIRLPVPDIDKAEERLQRLVAELGIHKTWGEIYHSSEMAPIVKPNGYKAVFVQATHPQLKQLLEKLQHIENDAVFQAMTIHHAIPLSGLDYESQYRINNPMLGPLMPVIPFRKLKTDSNAQLQYRSSGQSVLERYATQMKLHLPRKILDLDKPAPKPKTKSKEDEEKSDPQSKEGYLRVKKDGRYIWKPRPIRTIFILTDRTDKK